MHMMKVIDYYYDYNTFVIDYIMYLQVVNYLPRPAIKMVVADMVGLKIQLSRHNYSVK